jgi:hypothetical protein
VPDDGRPHGGTVTESRADVPAAGEWERFKDLAPLAVRHRERRIVVEFKHVEDDEHDRHRGVALEDPATDTVERGPIISAERDHFADD